MLPPHIGEVLYRRHKSSCRAVFADCAKKASVPGAPYPLSYTACLQFFNQWHTTPQGRIVLAEERELYPELSRALGDEFPQFLSQGAAESVSFWHTYEQTKTIYSVTTELWEGLTGAAFPGEFPLEHLRLPRPAFILDVPVEDADTRRMIFVHLNDTEEGGTSIRVDVGRLENGAPHWIKVMAAADGGALPFPLQASGVIELSYTTLAESWRNSEANAVFPGSLSEEDIRWVQTHDQALVRGVINLLLYMQGDDDVVQTVHPGVQPQRPPTTNPKKLAKRGNQELLQPHAQFEVGRRYSRVIEHWREQALSLSGTEDQNQVKPHGGMRPHVRSAHSHLYWTGVGREIPIVKYLPPVPVHGGVELNHKAMEVR